jgi:hypothetical protein
MRLVERYSLLRRRCGKVVGKGISPSLPRHSYVRNAIGVDGFPASMCGSG